MIVFKRGYVMLVAVFKKQKRLSNQLNFKIKVQFYYLRIYTGIENVSCRSQSFVTDGKDEHGLKLVKVWLSSVTTSNDMVCKNH